MKSRRRSLALLDELAPQAGPGGLGRLVDGRLDGLVGAHAVDQAAVLHAVEEAAVAVDVVVLQVHQGDLRVGERHVVAVAVGLDEAVLDDPVALAVEAERVLLDAR